LAAVNPQAAASSVVIPADTGFAVIWPFAAAAIEVVIRLELPVAAPAGDDVRSPLPGNADSR